MKQQGSLFQYLARLERFSDRGWYLPVLALLAAADLFVAFVPTDALVISSVLLRPKRCFSAPIWAALGSMLGALALAYLARRFGEPFILEYFQSAMQSEGWQNTASFLERKGMWALAFISIGPLPQQPAVLLCGLAHMPLPEVGAAVFFSRLIKYGLFAWIALHAPRLIGKLKIGREAAALKEAACPPDCPPRKAEPPLRP